MSPPSTLFEKIWNEHIVVPETVDTPAVLYIDLHLIHEVTTPQAFSLQDRNQFVKGCVDVIVDQNIVILGPVADF